MQNSELRISLVQYDIAWEDKSKNIAYINNAITKLVNQTDVVVLPEMCTTAFTFDTKKMAESANGETIAQIRNLAQQYDIAICGSFLCFENKHFYNRAFFITPTDSFFYDKRHLFRMGQEGEKLTAGKKKTIFKYKGFNMSLLVCYDLRFPVWSRNVNNEYDILIYVANWPEARREVWQTLLKARAIENMSYVCGVNRIGKDGNGLNHAGDSMLINPRGQTIITLSENKECIETVIINKELLTKDRIGFPVWKDADEFGIKNKTN